MILLWSGQKLPSYTIESSTIADLELSPNQVPRHEHEEEITTPVAFPRLENGPSHADPRPLQNVSKFVDPAIISYTRPPPSLSMRPLITRSSGVSYHDSRWNCEQPLG